MSTGHGPLPDVDDPRFAPFWAGTREHRIRIPRCTSCQNLVWPPRDTCTRCHAEELGWDDVSTEGALYTYTVVHTATVHGMTAPYVVGVVDIDGTRGVRLLGNILDCPPEAVEIGMRLRAAFCDVGERCTLVNWVPI